MAVPSTPRGRQTQPVPLHHATSLARVHKTHASPAVSSTVTRGLAPSGSLNSAPTCSCEPPLPAPGTSHAGEERLHAGARRAARLLRQPLPGGPLRRLLPDGRVPPAGHLLQPVQRRSRRIGPRALVRQRRRRPPPRLLRRQPLVPGRRPPPVQAARDDPVLRGPGRVVGRGGGRRRSRRRCGRGAGDELRDVRRRQHVHAGAPAVPGQGPRDRSPRLGPARRRPRRRRQRRRQRGRPPGGRLRRRRRGPLRHRAPLQEAHRGGPLQRPLPQELRPVPLPGERGSPEGGGVLLPRDTRRPGRRRAPVRVRQAGVGGAPRRGPRLQLLRPGRQGLTAQQPRPRRAGRLPLGHRRRRRARRDNELRRVRRRGRSPIHGFGDELSLAAAVCQKLTLIGAPLLLVSVLDPQ